MKYYYVGYMDENYDYHSTVVKCDSENMVRECFEDWMGCQRVTIREAAPIEIELAKNIKTIK